MYSISYIIQVIVISIVTTGGSWYCREWCRIALRCFAACWHALAQDVV